MTSINTVEIMTNGELLPPGWKDTDDPKKVKNEIEGSLKWAQGKNTILPHFLREDRIEAKIRTNATRKEPYVVDFKPSGECVVIKYSTGCYYAVCINLVGEWLGMVGEPAQRMDDESPLLQVVRV